MAENFIIDGKPDGSITITATSKAMSIIADALKEAQEHGIAARAMPRGNLVIRLSEDPK